MKLITTLRSPFGRKVYIMAIEKKLDSKIELVIEDLKNKSQLLLNSNPMGKVPVLILDNGQTLYDSPVIAQYIDSLNDKPKLIPANNDAKIYVLKTEAIADGMTEDAVGLFYENLKLVEARDAAKIEKSLANLDRCFKVLEDEAKDFGDLDLAQISIASALGYINFRLPDLGWQKKYPKLSAWFDKLSQRESMKKTMPRE